MNTRLDEFETYRLRMNERILEANHLGIKHFSNLPHLRHAFETIDLLCDRENDRLSRNVNPSYRKHPELVEGCAR